MKLSISALALAAALSASSALAADLPSRKAPPAYIPPPVMTWTGFYAGVNLGGGWQENNNNGGWWGGNNGGSRGGVVGGGQIGYNYQITPMFVVGVEADIQGTSMGGRNNNNAWAWAFLATPATPFWAFGGNNGGSRLDWFGTVRGRAGVTLLDQKLLVYGTGGFAYSNRVGWTAGGGAEYMFAPNWSVKAEYLYTDLSGNGNNGGWGWGWGNRHTKFHTVRAGVNYHFNFGAAPILAKY